MQHYRRRLKREGNKMSPILKSDKTKDETHIGDVAAKQPLSGTRVVTNIKVKGFNVNSFLRIKEPKKHT